MNTNVEKAKIDIKRIINNKTISFEELAQLLDEMSADCTVKEFDTIKRILDAFLQLNQEEKERVIKMLEN